MSWAFVQFASNCIGAEAKGSRQTASRRSFALRKLRFHSEEEVEMWLSPKN
jgi:hypothetical protein